MPLLCDICGIRHIPDDLSFAVDEPNPIFQVPSDQRPGRVCADSNFAVLDGETFFIRGLIVVPVHEHEPMLLGSWANVWPDHFSLMKQAREIGHIHPGSFHLPGRLTNTWECYPSLLNRRVRVIPQPDGTRPEFVLVDPDHPLFQHQREGISLALASSLIAKIMHSESSRRADQKDRDS